MKNKILSRFESSRDDIFLIDAVTAEKYSYGRVHKISSRLGRFLADCGLRTGDRVGIYLKNSPEYAMLYFACFLLDVTLIPVNVSLHSREIAYIIDHSKMKAIISDESGIRNLTPSYPSLRFIFLPSICELEKQPPKGPPALIGAENSTESLFSIMYTSGTSTRPKGVAHRASALFGNAESFVRAMKIDPSHRYYHVMPMSYMAGFLNTILCPFMAGGSVVIHPPFDARTAMTFWTEVIRHEANTFWFSPTMLSALLRLDRNPDGEAYCRRRVKRIFVGTAPLPQAVRLSFETKYGVRLLESYGLTEALLVSANRSPENVRERSVGPVLPGVELSFQNGEILIRTPFIMTGYLGPEDSQPERPQEWFATGDIGHLDDSGNLFINSRKKDLIIRGGINVSPRAVEEVLLEHDAVEQAAVIGLPHEFLGEEIVAVIKLVGEKKLSSQEVSLKELCRRRLNETAQPTRFIEIDQMPVNSNGKIKKNKLVEQFSAPAASL